MLLELVGGNFEEGDAIRKILLTLPKTYKPNKCVIEECHDLDKYTIDQLLGTLSAYEIVEMENIKRERKEVAFNVSNLAKDELEASENLDEIEEKFVRILKRGNGK